MAVLSVPGPPELVVSGTGAPGQLLNRASAAGTSRLMGTKPSEIHLKSPKTE